MIRTFGPDIAFRLKGIIVDEGDHVLIHICIDGIRMIGILIIKDKALGIS